MGISIEELARRNAAFAASGAFAGLPFPGNHSLRVVGCVDSRVDPSDVLGLKLGDAVVMRNIGGRSWPRSLRFRPRSLTRSSSMIHRRLYDLMSASRELRSRPPFRSRAWSTTCNRASLRSSTRQRRSSACPAEETCRGSAACESVDADDPGGVVAIGEHAVERGNGARASH
jgi:hypothetical protein